MKQITCSRNFRLLVAVLFCMISVAAVAQSAGFGAVSGVVTDSTGAVVAGAHVNLDNPSKGIHREMDSTSSGNFDFQNIVPASGYEVKVAKTGFGVIQYNEITVQVGGTVTLSPSLKVSGATTQVEVNSSAPLVDFQKTDTSLVVDSDQILELPINGRRVDNFVAFSPGVSNDGAFGLLSFRGNPGGNAFLTDGVDTTNSYYGENAGRTRTYNISQDAVQEFQVVTSNYAAEFGKASGGVVNTVTRSGSNNWHGSAYEFYRTATLAAIDRSTISGLAPKGINPPEWRHQAGVSVGGPIMKDKIFFFFNGEVFRRNAPAVSSNLNGGAGNNLFLGNGTVKPAAACSVAVAGQAACDAATAFVIGRASPQLIPRTMNNNMLFGKIDWHPTEKDSISFSSNYLDFESPNGIQTQLSLATGAAIGNNGDTTVHDRTGRVSWTRTIGNNMLNEARYGLFKDRQVDPMATDLVPTFGTTAAPVALTVNSVSNLGFAQNYPRVNPSELRNEFSDNFSWTKGKHNLKFGGTFSHVEDYVESMPSQFPFYQYSSLTTFAQDFFGTTAPGSQHYITYSQTVGNRVVDLAVNETSIYAQDEWHLSPKLTVSPGIRYEYSTLPQPDQSLCNPKFPETCSIPTNAGHVMPRLGLAYAMTPKTSVHAGYGMFYNRYTTSTIENLLVANGIYQKSYSYSTSGSAPTINATTKPCLPVFPQVNPFNWTPTGPCASTGVSDPNVMFADPNFHQPYSQQANLAIEREITKNSSLSVSYVWSRSLGIAVTKDLNVLDPVAGGPTAGYQVLDTTGAVVNSYTTPLYTTYNPAFASGPNCTTAVTTQCYKGRVAELQAGGNSYYNAMLVTFKHRQGNWFNGTASYTYGHTIGYGADFAQTFGSTTPSSYVNGYYPSEKGSSQLDRRHNLVVNVVLQPKFMKGNGAVAKYVVNGWQLAVINLAASSQATAPTINSSGTFTAAGALRGGSLNGLGSTMRVPFESLSGLNVGAVNRMDARLSKTFPITERVNVALGFEAFNVFNHLIVSGRDSQEYSISSTKNPAGFYTLTPRGTYGAINATQITPDGTTARRAQGLIRINF